VTAHWKDVHQWLADTRFGRQVAGAALHAGCRWRLAWFDQLSPARSQVRTLRGLLHQAQATRFGREHDFRRIRTGEDFRRLVPLTTPADLWRSYWQPVFPHLGGATWPGPLPFVAALNDPREDQVRPIALSAALQASRRAFLDTALAITQQVRPHARLLSGALVFLGDDTTLIARGEPDALASSEDIAAQGLPGLVRPYAMAGQGWGRRECMHSGLLAPSLADEAIRRPVTFLAGPAERLSRFLTASKQLAGEEDVGHIWPGLTTLLLTQPASSAQVEGLRTQVGGQVLLLEGALQPEGAIAVLDPRHGFPRLLTDHGVYFEFIPEEEVGKPQPTRHGVEDVAVGVPYEAALTSPAGLWACRVGLRVVFERRDPPLLRSLESVPISKVPEAPAPRQDAPAVSLPPPHRHSNGTPAVRPESFYHSPWSVLADRR
jgi:hypothetical protein